MARQNLRNAKTLHQNALPGRTQRIPRSSPPSGILFAGQDEVPDAAKVNTTWVFEKRDGQWLIAAYHNSPALAPAQ